jgi:streptogramin lyase
MLKTFAVLATMAVTLVAQSVPPPMAYKPVPDPFVLPEGVNFGGVAAMAVNSKGHFFVYNRGPHPLMEFTHEGRFVRFLFEGGMIQQAHGMRIDRDDNIWITDSRQNAVFKLSPEGRILFVLGSPGGETGDFSAHFKMALLMQPTSVAFGPDGEIYVAEGHGGEINRIRKFDRDGHFLKTWGGKRGSGPGEFNQPHHIMVGPDGLVYVTDRENHRFQIFDGEGNLKKIWNVPGSPNSLTVGPDGQPYATEAYGGHVWKLDWNGNVVAQMGGFGRAPGEFSEAHLRQPRLASAEIRAHKKLDGREGSKVRREAPAWELSGGIRLLPPAIGFVFDSDGKAIASGCAVTQAQSVGWDTPRRAVTRAGRLGQAQHGNVSSVRTRFHRGAIVTSYK